MRIMLNAIYGRDNGATLAARYQAYYSLARTGLSRDQFYAIDIHKKRGEEREGQKRGTEEREWKGKALIDL